MPTLFYTLAPLFLFLHHHRHPVTHHCIHHHIENGGGYWVSLCHSPSLLECCPIIPARPCYHFQPTQVCLEDPACLGSHAVAFQDLKAPEPFHAIIRLVQVQVDHVQDLLPQTCLLLNQFGLKGGGTCAATRPKSVEEVVEGYGGCEPLRHYLSHHLHKANVTVVFFPLGDQDHLLPRVILRKPPLPKCRPSELHHPLPIGSLRRRLLPAILCPPPPFCRVVLLSSLPSVFPVWPPPPLLTSFSPPLSTLSGAWPASWKAPRSSVCGVLSPPTQYRPT